MSYIDGNKAELGGQLRVTARHDNGVKEPYFLNAAMHMLDTRERDKSWTKMCLTMGPFSEKPP